MIGSLLSWEGCGLDDPFVRISMNYTLRRVIERIEGWGDKKIMVGVSCNKHYWAIHYRTERIILPREIEVVEEGEVKDKISLGLKHINIPIQLNLWETR
jgi:hypothetical protein